ncbi:MAG: hypothetical protein JW889_05600 [Verrucomicrobia bacterium]|nr:hypothetical protein [Verrucomicrobiota bacterium]
MLTTLLKAVFGCIAVLVLFMAPGAVLWRSVMKRYERVRRLVGELLGPVTSIIVQVAISMLITGWAGFVLGEIGVFSLHLLVGVVAGLSVLGMLATRLKPRELLAPRAKPPERRGRPFRDVVHRARRAEGFLSGVKEVINTFALRNEWFYAPVLIVIAAFLFMPPMRTVWRGHQSGRHLVCGMVLAERGSFRLDDPIGAVLWQGETPANLAERTRLDDNYRVATADPTAIYPAFLHFAATWIGIGHALLGRWGATHVTALAAVVAIVMFFLFVRAITSVKVALLAAALLGLNWAQAYFVRTSSPAIIAQLLVWTAFFFFVLFVRLEVKPFGMLVGVALGQLVLTGQHLYPALLIGWLVFACSTYGRYHPKKLYRFIVFAFLLFVFQPLLFDSFLGTYYTRNFARGLTEALAPSADGDWTARLPAAVARLGGIAGLVVFGTMVWRSAYRRGTAFRVAVDGVLAWRGGLALKLAGAAVALAYVVVFAARQPPYLVEAGAVVYHGKWFYQLIDELGFGFFLLGISLFAYFCLVRPRRPGLTFPFAVFFVSLVTAIWNPMTSGVLMHGAARLVPIYLPFAYFFVAYSLFALREVSGRLILGEAVKVLVAILAVVLPAVTVREQQLIEPWKRHEPGRNVLAQYDAFFREEPFPPNAIVLFDPDLVVTQAPLVMQLLYHTRYGVDAIVLDGKWADPAEAGQLVARLKATGRPVFFAHAAKAQPILPFGYGRGPELEFDIRTSILEETIGTRPRGIVRAGSSIVFVTLELRAAPVGEE